ncbi:hypothetical protein NFC81_09090 [Salinispirillum sp. LH 10-3-1]|uniref:Uncharacterized protein n=1 Tax=Salinispirillum sp. LH 10-3-1 TaxID=2952525 RepID=A0AB38YBY3_9GAMM
MATTRVRELIDDAKRILQEVSEEGTRWTNVELLAWLNESYKAIVQVKPDANTASASIDLVDGTRQSIPADGLRLLDVVRNTEGMAVSLIDRQYLDLFDRDWHRLPEQDNIEHFTFDERDPKRFYVYPPATFGTEVDVVYSKVPASHEESALEDENVTINIDDAYAPVMLDYILYRSFAKDSDDGGNMNRSMVHRQAFRESLGLSVQTDLMNSPNAS